MHGISIQFVQSISRRPPAPPKELSKQPILDLQTHKASLVDHFLSGNKTITPRRHTSPTLILGNLASPNTGIQLRLLQQFNLVRAPIICHASRGQEHANSEPPLLTWPASTKISHLSLVLGGLNHMMPFPPNLCGRIANTIAVDGGLISAKGTNFPSLIFHLYALGGP